MTRTGAVTEKNWPNFYVVLGQLKHPKLVKYPTCMLRLEHACLRGNTLQRHDSSARARSVASRYAGQRLSACAGHMCACRGQYLQQLPTRRWQRAPGTARTAWRAVDGAFNSSLACALVVQVDPMSTVHVACCDLCMSMLFIKTTCRHTILFLTYSKKSYSTWGWFESNLPPIY